MVLNTCFVLRSSSILHLAFQSAILPTLSFEAVLFILDNFPSCFMIHKFSRVAYLNPSFSVRSRDLFNQTIFLVGVILGYISPTAFPKECSYLWCLSTIQFSPSHLGEEVFHLFGALNQINGFH